MEYYRTFLPRPWIIIKYRGMNGVGSNNIFFVNEVVTICEIAIFGFGTLSKKS